MLYDLFLYNGETKMLDMRLHELDSCVDKFILLESDHTFRGNKKDYTFPRDKHLFSKFLHKILFVRHIDNPVENPWTNESNQRNGLMEGLNTLQLNSNDIIMLSDVDEIPDTNILNKLKAKNFNGVYTFYQNAYYYNTKCRNTEKWCGTVVFNYGSDLLKLNIQGIRSLKDYFRRIGSDGDYNSGGWHFSYCGDTDYIINKLRSFSHRGFDTPKYNDPEIIQKCIMEGKDLLFRNDEKFEIVENQTYLPKYVKILD